MRHLPTITGLLLVVLAQCRVGTAEEPNPVKYPDAAAYCAARAAAECSDEVIAACAPPSKDHCVSVRQAACGTDEVPSGKVYDPSKAEDCIAKVSDAYADAKLTKAEVDAYRAACALLFSGLGIKDSPCQADDDCKQSDGLRCIPAAALPADAGADAGPASGSCQVPKTVQGGDSCAAADALCVAGYHCGATRHCDINGDNTEPCSESLPCKADLKCSALTSTCEPKLTDGSVCTGDGECQSGICVLSATVASGLCVSQITLAVNELFCVEMRSQ